MQKQSKKPKSEENTKKKAVVAKKDKFDAKQAAQNLFVNTQMSQKDIASQLGVTEQTICRWKEEGRWDDLKGAVALSANNIIANLYKRAEELSADPEANADRLVKLAATIDKLKPTKNTLTTYITAFIDLGDWAKKNGYLEEAKILAKVQDGFIKHILSSI